MLRGSRRRQSSFQQSRRNWVGRWPGGFGPEVVIAAVREREARSATYGSTRPDVAAQPWWRVGPDLTEAATRAVTYHLLRLGDEETSVRTTKILNA